MLRSIFFRLDYPIGLINSAIDMFIQNTTIKPEKRTDDGNMIRLVLPFKDEIAANAVRRQLRDLSSKISVTLQPIERNQPGHCKSALRSLQIYI